MEAPQRRRLYLPLPVKDIVGRSFDIFHRHLSHRRNLLSDPANLPHVANIRLGAETLRLQVSAIQLIVKRIEGISHVSSAIAAAVEEQSTATAEIAGNIQQVAQGTNLVATNIGGVTEAAGMTGAASQQVLASAKSLSREAEQLDRVVTSFLQDVRVA